MFQNPEHPRHRPHHHDPHRGPGSRGFGGGFRDMFGRERWGGGRPMRRGEIRSLILAALTSKAMHGYEVIQDLEARSGGRWRPSAGSVYPTLQQLSDEGLVTGEEIEGRRVYRLTDAGRAAAEASPITRSWSDRTPNGEPDLRQLGGQLLGAVMQIERVGSPNARRETNRILADARRQLYRLLADDETDSAGEERPAEQA